MNRKQRQWTMMQTRQRRIAGGGGPSGPGNPWDLSGVIYESKFGSVSTQESDPTGMFIKSDGTAVYVVGGASDAVYQYTFGVPWDISTITYSGKLKDVSPQEPFSTGLFFSSDGTKMYSVGSTNDRVSQYNLSTAWDVSTASYSGLSFLTTGQILNPQSVSFRGDGAKMYITGFSGQVVHQYSLSNPWVINSVTYDSKSYDVTSQSIVPFGQSYKPDGLRMYLATSGDNVHEYPLSTAWDLSTGSYASVFAGLPEAVGLAGMQFKPDGLKLYGLSKTNGAIYQYAL